MIFLCLSLQVSRFAARGGQLGGRNQRKSFGAELADPYALPDENALPHVDAALRVVCKVSVVHDQEKNPIKKLI